MHSERIAKWARVGWVTAEALIHVLRGVSAALGEIEVGARRVEAERVQGLQTTAEVFDRERAAEFNDEPVNDLGPSHLRQPIH